MRPRLSCMLMLALAPLVAGAHHPIEGLYDHSRTIKVTGTISGVEWVNPHVVFFLEVPGDKAPRVWRMELDSPGVLQRRGWTRESIRAGQKVVVTGYPLKTGEPAAVAETIELPDGTRLTGATEGSWSWQQLNPGR